MCPPPTDPASRAGSAEASLPVHCFISYASEDREHARRLSHGLLGRVRSVWWDRDEIEGGEEWKREIDRGLRRSGVVVALLSSHSVDPGRRWVRCEHELAATLLREIIPVVLEPPLLDPARLPTYLRPIQYLDFTEDWDAGLRSLEDRLGKLSYRPGPDRADQEPPLEDAFVGRDVELRQVAELMAEARDAPTGVQLVTVQGMGGAGKTVLARELVRRLAPKYPGGVIVEQRQESPEEPGLVYQRWARLALGRAPDHRYSQAEVRDLLSDAFGTLLFLIDDVPESDFEKVRALLGAMPVDASRIVTSRSRNARTELGGLMYEIPGLSDDDAVALVFDRVRARGSGPPRAATDALEEALQGHRDDVLRLVHGVDGHALALELAAAQCRNPGRIPRVVDRLLGSLGSNVEELRVRVAGEVTRSNSVARSLAVSLRDLDLLDQRDGTDLGDRFVALGALPDRIPLDGPVLAATWGTGNELSLDDERTLDDLVDRALLRPGADEEGAPTWLLHPLIRAFADGLLAERPDHRHTVRRRYCDHVVARAREGFARPRWAWDEIEPLLPHVRFVGAGLLDVAAMIVGGPGDLSWPDARRDIPIPGRGAELDAWLPVALDFSKATLEYVIRRPEVGEMGRDWLRLGLAAARARSDPRAAALFLQALGGWFEGRDPSLAERYFAEALDLADRLGDDERRGAILTYYGELLRTLDRNRESRALLEAAVEIHRARGDGAMEATTLKKLGENDWRLADYGSALANYERALELYREVDDRAGAADMLNKVGSVAFNQGERDRAIAFFREARDAHRAVGNRIREGEDLNDLGIALVYEGRPAEAIPHLDAALRILVEVGDRRLQAITLTNLAAAHYAEGRYGQARVYAERGVEEARHVGSSLTECWALNRMGLAARRLGERDTAREALEAGLAVARTLDNPRALAGSLAHLGELLTDEGDPVARGLGTDRLREALEVLEAADAPEAFGGTTQASLRARIADLEAR